ncbi:Flp family type IVb pilin [Bordetella petrii]|nr:Flp family type IVb pilin [Bordetella petrii]
MKEQLVKFWNDEDGVTALEYGLIAGLIATAIIAAFAFLGDGLESLFTSIKGKMVITE